MKFQFTLCIYSFGVIFTVFSDETCKVPEKPKLQIVFVVDLALNQQKYPFLQGDLAYHIAKRIKNDFESEFALVGFTDYRDDAQPRAITKPEACYFLMQGFTTNQQTIYDQIRTNPFKDDHSNVGESPDEHDSVITAMLFSAVEKKLSWNNGYYDSQGKLVRKIMIPMVFTGITTRLEKPGNRTFPKADGTDTCTNALIPTYTQLDQVLFEHEFAVVNCITNVENKKLGLTENIYKTAFGENLFVPYYQVVFPKPGQTVKPNDYNYKDFVEKFYEVVSNEVMQCEWEDPVAYNTLGL